MRGLTFLPGFLLATALPAQQPAHPQTRHALTLSIGLGAGSAAITCDNCADDRENATAFYLRMGGAVKPNLIIGGELDSWSKTRGGAQFKIISLNGVAQWYPMTAKGFFVLGGAGAGYIDAEVNTSVGLGSNHGTGFAYEAGTGYDFRIARKFSLTPYATYFGTSGVAFHHGISKADGNVLHVGLAFTWH